MYNIEKYYEIGFTDTKDDLRSNNHHTVRTVIFTNGKNYMIQEYHWASYVGTRPNRIFIESESEFNAYVATYFRNGLNSIKRSATSNAKFREYDFTKQGLDLFYNHSITEIMDALDGTNKDFNINDLNFNITIGNAQVSIPCCSEAFEMLLETLYKIEENY